MFRGANPVLLLNLNEEAESYLRTKERGFLATIGKEGPTVIPVCFAYESGKIYSAIDRKPKSGRELARVKNIEKNPRVAFILDTYSDDWRRLSVGARGIENHPCYDREPQVLEVSGLSVVLGKSRVVRSPFQPVYRIGLYSSKDQ
ncbi:MAG: hypothetical protein E6K84_06975 [Thaumarchaeota archaeon]|nr:MAG: hypothetical protein E6K84_06975 [Nitrososphaerota archaeon]